MRNALLCLYLLNGKRYITKNWEIVSDITNYISISFLTQNSYLRKLANFLFTVAISTAAIPTVAIYISEVQQLHFNLDCETLQLHYDHASVSKKWFSLSFYFFYLGIKDKNTLSSNTHLKCSKLGLNYKVD